MSTPCSMFTCRGRNAGIFYNEQTVLQLRRILHALGHHQPPTPIKTDNKTTKNFVHNNMHLRKSKTWDMQYYWLRDQSELKNIKVYWKRGKDEEDPNKADYHTKHHSTVHHRGVRPFYVHDKIMNMVTMYNHMFTKLRGCVISHPVPNSVLAPICE